MPSPIRPAAAWVLFALLTPAVGAHFTMLFPEPASARKGEAVTVVHQWGHPFEHQLFNAQAPESVAVLSPDGKQADLTDRLEIISIPAGGQKKATAHRLSYRPEQRGDYVFILKSRPIWMEEEQEFVQDTVKAVLHVQAQKGWDAAVGKGFELVPLTRPYGLQPGTAFQAQALVEGKPLAGALVEIERYNPVALKEEDLPPDEQRTRAAKTDAGGAVVCTLAEPGWWCLTAHRGGGKAERDGKAYPLRQRAIFWVYVDEKAPQKSGK
jgi:cobalt/nickel transport protein